MGRSVRRRLGVRHVGVLRGAGLRPISVVAPLAGVLNAAVPVAVGIALGERPGHAASAGVVLATVVLAMAVLRERVTRWQGIGMAMAMGSVAMIAAG